MSLTITEKGLSYNHNVAIIVRKKILLISSILSMIERPNLIDYNGYLSTRHVKKNDSPNMII